MLLNRGGVADFHLLRTLLAISKFCEVRHSLLLLAYANLTVSKTLLQQLLTCLNFTLDSENLFYWYKQKKNDFYELWQQHKQLKTMEISKAWPIIYDEGYVHSSLNPLTKFINSSRGAIDHENRPNQNDNSHKLCNETRYPFLSLSESQC